MCLWSAGTYQERGRYTETSQSSRWSDAGTAVCLPVTPAEIHFMKGGLHIHRSFESEVTVTGLVFGDSKTFLQV